MVIPWLGFQMSKLIKHCNPLSSARYIKFTTFYNPKIATEQKARWYPWPYTEGLTIEEANHELSFLVFGAYGKNLHNQFGAPIRLHLPWKYGFKSIKSIVEIEFTDKRPISFWENLGHPKKFYLIELGAGNGEMMKVMIESFKKFPYFLNSCEIIIYEKSPYLKQHENNPVNWFAWNKKTLQT